MGKTVMVSKFSEWKGLDRIGPIVHSMPSIFREISKDDFGIDGEIEIVVPKAGGEGFETTGGIIKVQSKSGASYIKQQLFTLSDLRNPQCPLRLFCDTTTIRDLPTAHWIEEEQGANNYIFLLNQLLSAHLQRNGLHFQHDLHRHYFPRRDETSEEFKHEWLSVRSGHTAYRAIAKHYRYGKESYWRHLAAKFAFKRFGSLLCLLILPKYFYTTDGETPYDTTKVGAATTRIKAVEHDTSSYNA